MGTVGTFDGFTTARLGIYAAQHGLRVTGNNISNLNTVGYTRQRLDQVSLKTGGNDVYRSQFDNHVGNGALVTSINQVRDPYLDIRFRNTAASVGYHDTTLAGLNEISDTLDEVGREITKDTEDDGVLYAQILDVLKQLEGLSENPTKGNDTLVRNSAEALCGLFHTYADKLETLRENTVNDLEKKVSATNEILTNIRNLNESIREAEIHGDNALEMRDERNRQIDELSQLMHINVTYTMEDIGAGIEVEKLTISLGDSNPDPLVKTDSTVLVDGIYGSQISIKKVPTPNPDFDTDPNNTDPTNLPYLDQDGNPCAEADAKMIYDPQYTIMVSKLVDQRNIVPKDLDMNKGRPVTLDDNDLFGSVQAIRELLTEKGEFSTTADVAVDENAAIKRGIPYYQLSMDLLAKKFADTYNELNQGAMVDENGDLIYEQQTGTPKDLGLREAANGYYVDVSGYYVGNDAHGQCVLTKAQINERDDMKTAMLKIKDADAAFYNQHKAALFPNGENGAVDEDEAQKVLLAFMKAGAAPGHGVAAAGNPPDQPLTVYATVAPEGVGPLFSNRNDNDDPSGINASNISISHSWSTGDVKIVPTYVRLHDGTIQNTTKNENVDHMISKLNEDLVYNPKDLIGEDCVSSKLYTGSFNGMYDNMCSTLGEGQRSANVQLNTSYTQLVEIDTSRDGVSGVDLNDEAMNMMQFQKAYSAACRMMTAIDEAIDRLINNTGIAGR